MTLQTSGRIDLSDVNLELKIENSAITATTRATLNAAKIRTLAGKASGRIAFSDLYGKSSHVPVFTYTSFSQTSTWVRPERVTAISLLDARGGSGSPEYAGTKEIASESFVVLTVASATPAYRAANPGLPAATGPGTLYWDTFQGQMENNVNLVNDAGIDQGHLSSASGIQYAGEYWYSQGQAIGIWPLNPTSLGRSRIPGTGFATYSGSWQSSGPVVVNSSGYEAGQATINYQYFTGNVYGASPATTGANTTAFGYTFPGGVGGQATQIQYGNIPVSAASYQIVVPPGGLVMMWYYN